MLATAEGNLGEKLERLGEGEEDEL